MALLGTCDIHVDGSPARLERGNHGEDSLQVRHGLAKAPCMAYRV
jgi:hypothetical protein